MPARLHLLPAACAFALLLPAVSRAQQLPATTAPESGAPSSPAPGSMAPLGAPGAPTAPTSALTSPTDAAQRMIADAIQRMNANDVDGALSDLNRALQANPNSTGAYVLRASIYCQKKLWTQGENDFKAAAKITPNNAVLKFNLVEIKFMQKQYDAARPGFLALEKDPDVVKNDPGMSDFASYKVFLCDLFGGHEAVAKQELDVFDDVMGNPSYYFGNAAWSLVHKNVDDARSWLLSASRIYPPRKNLYYAQSLRDLGYLPIPAPGDVVTPAAAGHPSHP